MKLPPNIMVALARTLKFPPLERWHPLYLGACAVSYGISARVHIKLTHICSAKGHAPFAWRRCVVNELAKCGKQQSVIITKQLCMHVYVRECVWVCMWNVERRCVYVFYLASLRTLRCLNGWQGSPGSHFECTLYAQCRICACVFDVRPTRTRLVYVCSVYRMCGDELSTAIE